VRLVSVADTHTFEADLGELPAGDVFIHVGDLTRGGELEEMRTVAAWINEQPHRHKIIVPGNHDWCFLRERRDVERLLPDVHVLVDERVSIDGVRFWGSPWQPEFHNWAYNLPRGEALARKWALIPPDTDVLLTHGPPAGYGDTISISTRSGCADLLDAVRQIRPRLHLFGHIHQDGGLWTEDDLTFANVTTWECERDATVIDIDAETKAVTAVDVPARERPR